MMVKEPRRVVRIRYRKADGEVVDRRVIPARIWFKPIRSRPEPQWVMEAWDFTRGREECFTIKDILNWEPEAGG